LLTDYHLHLREDEDDRPPEREAFTAENVERYLAAAEERGIAELGCSEHVYRFTDALEIWRHPFWEEQARDDLDAYCEFVRGETDLKLGIEADFIPGREDRMATLLEARDWDYVVGSVHFLGDHAVDYDLYDVWTTGHSAEKVWARYFDVLGEAARSGLFDILAHPDLVKMWGPTRPRPEGDLRRFYDRAMEGIAESGIAVEVSTAGLRKPTKEIYPDRAFLEMLVDAGNPVALSSDAHTPDQLGYEYERAQELLADVGVSELCVFERRTRRLEPIGPA
jgi:histidinol-phosphatase (PHP family)